MGKSVRLVRLSSKGQIVVPAEIRRRCGLRVGDALVVRAHAGREIVFTPVEISSQDVDRMLREARSWFSSWAKRTGRDPLREFHRRRQRERETEVRKRERRSH